MRLLLLSADIANPMPNIGDHFITRGIEQLFHAHETLRRPLHRPPTDSELVEAKDCDAIIICGTNIVGENGTVRCGWTLDHFEQVGLPVIPLGLGSQADRSREVELDEKGQRLLAYWRESSGPLSVRDELTAEAVERYLGEGSAVLTGCPSTILRQETPGSLRQHTIFCPPAFHYRASWMPGADWPKTLVQTLFRELGSHRSAVYLVQQPSDFLFDAAKPGWKTVHSPLYPENHLILLCLAREILSFRIHPCLVGVANGTPAVLLSLDARTESLAKTYGIPFLRVSTSMTAKEILDLAMPLIENYPWRDIKERLGLLEGSLVRHVQSLTRLERAGDPGPVTPRSALSVACITDRAYFGRFLGLVENLRRVARAPFELHALFLDEESVSLARRHVQHVHDLTLHIYRPSDIWEEGDWKAIHKRSTAEIAYSSKAALMRKVLDITDQPVLFCDTDLFFYQSPEPLFGEVPHGDVLLFPHWNETTPTRRWHGLFNSGMVLAKPSAKHFLEWWSSMCLRFWGKGAREGVYFEQGFLDLAPVLFEGVKVYRGKDHNVGPWNVESLDIRLPEESPWTPRLGESAPLKSYHAASADTLGLFEVKNSWDQVVCLARGLPFSVVGEDFREWLVTSQARYWPALKRVVFVFQTLRYRLRIKSPFPSQRLLYFMTRGHSLKAIWLLSHGYSRSRDLYRKWRRKERAGVELLPVR